MTKAPWEKDLEDWGQGFGNMFGGFLGMFFVIAIVMFFYEGCSYEGLDRNDKIVSPEEQENNDPSARVLFK